MREVRHTAVVTEITIAAIAAAETSPVAGCRVPAEAGMNTIVSNAGMIAAGRIVNPATRPSAVASAQHASRGFGEADVESVHCVSVAAIGEFAHHDARGQSLSRLEFCVVLGH